MPGTQLGAVSDPRNSQLRRLLGAGVGVFHSFPNGTQLFTMGKGDSEHSCSQWGREAPDLACGPDFGVPSYKPSKLQGGTIYADAHSLHFLKTHKIYYPHVLFDQPLNEKHRT